MTQITEKKFRESLNVFKDKMWFIKLQVLPMTFTKSPADFIILSNEYRYLVECKEVNCIKKNESFYINRLTQKNEMINFEALNENNIAMLLIMFRKKNMRESSAFFIPLKLFIEFEKKMNKKYLSCDDFLNNMREFKLNIKENKFDLEWRIV
jgi:hypothetical protein